MPKTPKPKKDGDPQESSWSEDQKERGYYYDDSHGYEVYCPEDDDREDEEGTTKDDRA